MSYCSVLIFLLSIRQPFFVCFHCIIIVCSCSLISFFEDPSLGFQAFLPYSLCACCFPLVPLWFRLPSLSRMCALAFHFTVGFANCALFSASFVKETFQVKHSVGEFEVLSQKTQDEWIDFILRLDEDLNSTLLSQEDKYDIMVNNQSFWEQGDYCYHFLVSFDCSDRMSAFREKRWNQKCQTRRCLWWREEPE